MAAARERLKGWRLEVREEDDGARSISAERGYLRETGNLVFHFAMLGLIVALALGKMFNYEGQVVVLANGSEFCNSGTFAYDSFTPGLRVDGTDLDEFCVKVDDFTAHYLPTGAGRLLPRRPAVPGGRGPREQHVAPLPARGQPPAAHRGRPGLPARQRLRAGVLGDLPQRREAHRHHPVAHRRQPHQPRRGRHEVRPAGRARPGASGARSSSRSPACSRRPRSLHGKRARLRLPGPERPGRRDRRAARRPRQRVRPRPVHLHRRPVHGGQWAAEAGRAGEPAARRGADARRRHGGPLRRRAALGVPAGLARPGAGVGAGLRDRARAGPRHLAGRQAAPAVGARDPGHRRTNRHGRTVVLLGGLARTDQAGYGEEFRRFAAELLAELAPDGGDDDPVRQDVTAGRKT